VLSNVEVEDLLTGSDRGGSGLVADEQLGGFDDDLVGSDVGGDDPCDLRALVRRCRCVDGRRRGVGGSGVSALVVGCRRDRERERGGDGDRDDSAGDGAGGHVRRTHAGSARFRGQKVMRVTCGR